MLVILFNMLFFGNECPIKLSSNDLSESPTIPLKVFSTTPSMEKIPFIPHETG